MVQKAGFRVLVCRTDGRQFPEVQDPRTGDIYVVASPGELFEIQYEVLTPMLQPRPGPPATYRFTTTVDGRTIGCSRLASPTAKDIGFVRQGTTTSITYDLFKFAEAAADSGTMAESLAFAEGRITVSVEEVQASGEDSNVAASVKYNQPAAVASLPEGKKFFLAPSLTTAVGGEMVSRGFSAVRYDAVSGKLATFDIRYETPSTLLLRKILERSNPIHAAILDSFEETRHRPPPTGVEVKQERRVKRERGAPEVIDLSGPGRLPMPPAERLGPGEILECDLTAASDDEEAAPRWAKRRAVVEEEEVNLEDVASTQIGGS